MRRRAAPICGVVLVAALSACSSAPVPPRTKPNEVEQTAVAVALNSGRANGTGLRADSLWTQLWTPTQASARIARCVSQGSDGLVVVDARSAGLGTSGFDYSVSYQPKSATVDGGVGPPYFDPSTVDRLVAGCFATYPVDFRIQLVALDDREALYSYDLTVLRRCLLAHGQRVPPLPNRTRFENLMRAGVPWNAYDLVVVTSRAEWYALADACPALPPGVAGVSPP